MRKGSASIPRLMTTLFQRWGLIRVADPQELVDQQGRYFLLLRAPACRIRIGALGSISFVAGLYGYVGSACGRSVTLGHRMTRHMRRRKVCRWHIDYLTTARAVMILGAYWTADPAMTEARLASLCAERFPVVHRFGNSDSHGASGHLFVLLPQMMMGQR